MCSSPCEPILSLVMKLIARYSACFAITVFIIGITVHNQHFKARRRDLNDVTRTIGRYVHPFNSTIQGVKEFWFAEHTYKLFKRLNNELEAGETVSDISVASYTKYLKPVTAVSSNHFVELMARIDVMAKFMPANVPIVIYDLGLSESEVKTIKNMSFVDYRIFDFSSYPVFVRRLKTYAWKPLIIQKILAEFGGALWMDSSIIFQESYEKIVRYMVDKNSSFLYYIKRAGDTIISGSDHRIFEFFPMRGIEQKTARIPQAGAILTYNTAMVRQDVMKWVLACCLFEDCIDPLFVSTKCPDKYPLDRFSGCHLFDQSIFAIIVSNAYDSREEMYTLPEEMLAFAYPWRVRNDNMFLSKEFVIVYIVLAVAIALIMLLKWRHECFLYVKYFDELLRAKCLVLYLTLALVVAFVIIVKN